MADTNYNVVRKLEPEQETRLIFEQYKVLAENLNKVNEIRETSNNFWVGVNGLGISALAYLRDTQTIVQDHKPLLLWTLVVIGISLCLSWLFYLKTINSSIATRNKLLVETESHLPIAIFAKVFSFPPEKVDKPRLTLGEMAVPCLFLAGYVFFGILLYFFTDQVLAPVPK